MPEQSAKEAALAHAKALQEWADGECPHMVCPKRSRSGCLQCIDDRDAAIAVEARETAIEECLGVLRVGVIERDISYDTIKERIRALRATPARAIGQSELPKETT